ncbi:substrate-binding domain-containing protein [Halobaculum lipolyticum]|uniref:Substrate-binding domain-containing protein n=1 Tax=Halobaculum lipolyticum TaxID=3032001 RepID=A0ABD5WI11_9EURY|nr:substrate-binding domain-containing protein [Halobaculum sp. DT31]
MPRTRRATLSALAGAVGVAGVAGVVGTRGGPGGDAAESVSLLAAGSLARAVDRRLRPRLDADVDAEFHGSAVCARLVGDGLRDPDVLVLADPALFAGLAEQYTAFATNELVVAYDPERPGGRAVRDADRPFDALLDRDLRWGRTDPDADPLGYRTLFSLRLAADLWGRPYQEALAPGQLFPEAELLAVFESGELDAAVVYRNMAIDHGVAFRSLPPAVNLGAPAHAAAYAEESYELPDGTVVRGTPVEYGAVARRSDPAVESVFGTLVGGDWTGDAFGVPASYPVETSVGGR